MNTYHYAGNNPIKYVDPDGNSSVVVSIGSAIWNGVCSLGVGVASAVASALSFVATIALPLMLTSDVQPKSSEKVKSNAVPIIVPDITEKEQGQMVYRVFGGKS